MTEFDAVREVERAIRVAQMMGFKAIDVPIEALQLVLDRATGKGERAPM